MKRLLPLLMAFAMLAARPAAGAEPAGPQIVKAELLADTSAVKPGSTFRVGVRLTLEPGWHVYWINPGDSGVATKVKIDAPEGFKVGDVCYPVPTKFDQPGQAI